MGFKKIIRGLIDEREPELKEILVTQYFNQDIIIKTFRLFYKSNFRIEPNGIYGSNSYTIINQFYEKLEFEVPTTLQLVENDPSILIDYLLSKSLNTFLHIIELFTYCLLEQIKINRLGVDAYWEFQDDLNNFYDKNSIPFQLHFKENLFEAIVLKKDNEIEEDNKKQIFNLLKDNKYKKVNEYFTNSLKENTKGEYKEAIEESYKAIEKLLKILVNNQNLNFVPAYKEFKKKYNKKIKGIFGHYDGIIFNRIDNIQKNIEQIANEIERHSDKEKFNTNDFLQETSRFHLNDVMNLILLLFKIIE